MKITNYVILFFIFIIPMSFMLVTKSSAIKDAQKLSEVYETAMTTATIDASRSLLENEKQEFESGYHSAKFTSANVKQAQATFFRTLYTNFGVVNDPIGQGVLKSYLPVLSVLDYDSLHLYVMSDYQGEDGMSINEHVWLPPIPFVFTDENKNLIYFTLDDFITIYDSQTQEWDEGKRDELAIYYDIPLLHDEELFEAVRKTTIVTTFQDEIEHYINKHNTYAQRLGISYRFTLPRISEEDWLNTIDDIGVLSFLQGIPLGMDYEFNNYAFGGGRLVKNLNYEGIIQDGVRTAYRSDCDHNFLVRATFTSAKQAAENGYLVASCQSIAN